MFHHYDSLKISTIIVGNKYVINVIFESVFKTKNFVFYFSEFIKMRDSIDLIEKTLQEYSDSKNIQSNLLNLVESLHRNLEAERSSSSLLQQQIDEFTKNNNNIPSKLTTLKGQYDLLQEKIALLKNENVDLNIQLMAKSQESKQLIEEKENQLNSLYTMKLKAKDEEIKQKERELSKLQESIKLKEQQLFNELHTVEASSSVELKRVIDEFQKQLNESNQRLKDSIETCNILRIELMSVKEQFAEYKRLSSEKISELQKRLREELNNEEDTLVSKEDSSCCVNNKTDSAVVSKYQPLDVTSTIITNLTNNGSINSKKVPVYRGSIKYVIDSPDNSKNSLPSLIPLKEKKTENRKRKLYNPDDFTYLMMDLDDNN